MTPVHAQELEPQPSGMGEFSRLTGVFFEPGKTFKDIAERPRWIVPLLLLMLMTVCYLSVIGHKIGWETVVTQQMEARMATMSDQQRTAMQNNMQTYVRFGAAMAYGAGLLGMPLYFLASAGVLMLIVNAFMSAGLRFKQIFAIVCYAGLPGLIHSAAASAAVLLKANPEEFNIQNPLPFNPGWFMAPDTSAKFLQAVATSLDAFAIWALLLTAIGLSAAGGKRLTFGSAFLAVVTPWAILTLVLGVLATL